MLNVAPLWTFFVPILAVATAAYIYRRMFPYEVVKESIRVVSEYKSLEREAKDKRAQKRLRSLRPRYQRARRILRTTTIVKFVLLMAFYIATSMTLIRYHIFFPAPAWIPLLTVEVNGHLVINPLLLHLLGYLYALIAFREALL
jgi:hypothetical protein